ncbi:MAG TPA: MMPL family transporter [Burkholderiales bacterium]|nr:MMPL family transporter [Burkholderiales bacterium]
MSLSARWVIGTWLALLLACIVVISRTEIRTDLSAFLPSSPTPAQQILVDQLRDGVVSRLILIGIEGGETPALALASKRLARQLRQQQSFASVDNGEGAAFTRDREFLWRNRYLLSPAISAEHFSSAALRAALEDDLQLLGSPAAMLLQRVLPNDPTGELLRLLEQFEGLAKPDSREGVWFSKDGKRALLVAQSRAAGYDLDAQEQALKSIRDAFSNAPAAGNIAAQKLLLSGPAVFSVNSRASIKTDAWRFSLIATVLVATLLLALYRSWRVLVLGLLPVASGALAGIAAVSLGFGSVHGITLGFGVTLIGEGVDYAIYLFTQIAPGTTPEKTLDRIWPTLRLGVLTSICGFSAMLLSSFPGLAQLGLFSIAGLIVAVAVTRYVLPILLPSGFTVHATAVLAPAVATVVQRAPRLRLPLILVVVLAAAFLIVQRGALWSGDLASLSPIAISDQRLDAQLRRDIGAPDVRHLIVVTAENQDLALEAAEKAAAALQRLSQRGLLEGFESPALYLPSLAVQHARQAALPEPWALRANLQHAQQGLPFRAGLFEPFVHDVTAAKQQPLLNRDSLQGTSLALKLDSLLVKRSNGWAAMLPLRGVADAAALGQEIEQPARKQAVLLDLKRESDQLYRTYRREITHFSLLGAGVIALLLLISLRSARRVFDVMAPLAAAVIVTAGVLVLTGTALSIFHLIGLLLVVAVGSNYALFFDRQTASAQDRERTIVSLVFANVTTVIGFGLLAFSKVPVLNAIGSTVGIGAILSLVFSAILITRAHDTAVSRR